MNFAEGLLFESFGQKNLNVDFNVNRTILTVCKTTVIYFTGFGADFVCRVRDALFYFGLVC